MSAHVVHVPAVGEGEQRGSVPGLHDEGVELVEVLLVRLHVLVRLPGLGHHHEHALGQGAVAGVEQELQHVVHTPTVAHVRLHHRVQLVQRHAQPLATQHNTCYTKAYN